MFHPELIDPWRSQTRIHQRLGDDAYVGIIPISTQINILIGLQTTDGYPSLTGTEQNDRQAEKNTPRKDPFHTMLLVINDVILA
jgi:hypothetical protein